MKKIYSVFLSLFMVFSLVGCAGKASAAGTFEGVGKGLMAILKSQLHWMMMQRLQTLN